jgi:hypothetical protein
MSAEVQCPVCGHYNLLQQSRCEKCLARLISLPEFTPTADEQTPADALPMVEVETTSGNDARSDQTQPVIGQARPWPRFWARRLDIYLFTLFFGFFLGFVYPELLFMGELALGFVALFIYVVLVEPMLLATWGTTPGKALLKINLRTAAGEKLTYADGLNRNFNLWWKGLGIGIPLLTTIAWIIAYDTLSKNAKTSWDRDGNFVVMHEEIGVFRTIIAMLFFLFIFWLIGFGA